MRLIPGEWRSSDGVVRKRRTTEQINAATQPSVGEDWSGVREAIEQCGMRIEILKELNHIDWQTEIVTR